MRSARKFGFILILVLLLGACSQQKRLTHRVAQADRVIFLCNVMGDDFSTTITGKEANLIVQALANGRKLNPDGLACSPSSRLEFFKGPEHLATITNCSQVFWIGETPYQDKLGTLEKLYERAREQYFNLKRS